MRVHSKIIRLEKISHLTLPWRVVRLYLTEFKIRIIFYQRSTSRNILMDILMYSQDKNKACTT